MTNENTVTSFPCKDSAADGCPNTVAAADTHCADCAEFHASMAETKAMLNDDSWKPVADTIAAVDAALAPLVAGFEIVTLPDGAVDNLPVIVHAEQSDLVIVEDDKPDLDSVCYTMNAAEVDCQAALFQIVDILRNLNKSLNDVDNALEIIESNCDRTEAN